MPYDDVELYRLSVKWNVQNKEKLGPENSKFKDKTKFLLQAK